MGFVKKAPVERFFANIFFRFPKMDILKLSFFKSQKTFSKKIVLREPFFGDFFWRLFYKRPRFSIATIASYDTWSQNTKLPKL